MDKKGLIVVPPAVTVDQMREVDRLTIEDYHIDLLQLMENAGAALAAATWQLLSPEASRVLVLAGPGNNGGGGLAAARRLAGWGATIDVVLGGDWESPSPAAGHQLAALSRTVQKDLSGGTMDAGAFGDANSVLIDALIGYGLQGNPRGGQGQLIEFINQSSRPVVSLDVPSGLDADTGRPLDPCVRAHTTVTLALPKQGLLQPAARGVSGRLLLADIGIPREVIQTVTGEDYVFPGPGLVDLTP